MERKKGLLNLISDAGIEFTYGEENAEHGGDKLRLWNGNKKITREEAAKLLGASLKEFNDVIDTFEDAIGGSFDPKYFTKGGGRK